MSKSIVHTNFSREETASVKEYIECELYDNESRGVTEIAENNAKAAQEGLATLCQILADRGFLVVEDIVEIANTYEAEVKLVDDEVEK